MTRALVLVVVAEPQGTPRNIRFHVNWSSTPRVNWWEGNMDDNPFVNNGGYMNPLCFHGGIF